MVYTASMFTVKQLSKLAGITPRTLRYYDHIGLLKPSRVGTNGYRYYGQEALLKLQQILFYRELELPLERIHLIINQPGFDPLVALENHKLELSRRRARLERLITTVDDTILHLKGKKEMNEKQLFAAFSDEEQAEMEKEALQLYDPETVKASNRKWKAYTAEEKQRILDEGNAIYLELVAAIPHGPESPEAQVGIVRWRCHMDYFWTPDPDQLVALADHYSLEPRFKANFDKIDSRLAEFMGKAVRIYVERRK